MSLLDIFTGDSAKKAAAENTARLNASKTAGMGYLDQGKSGALAALQPIGANYSGLQDKYGAGTGLYLDALGVNGQPAAQAAQSSFTRSPGYDLGIDAGLDAINRRRAAGGMLNSGNADLDAQSFGQLTQNKEYNGWLDRLGNLVSPEMQAAGGAAGVAGQTAGIYTNDANQRVGLETGITSGVNNQATQAANAEMQGSGNLWGLGLNLAKLGVGALSGGGGTALAGLGSGGFNATDTALNKRLFPGYGS